MRVRPIVVIMLIPWCHLTAMAEETVVVRPMEIDDVLVNPGSIMEVVSAFLAVLELVKMGVIDVFQNRLFGDIRITASQSTKLALEEEVAINES